ncbi:OLC1v1018811C1 [Oldenlandia corymbosa var. corymbosa]|uniref:OLC1v1018811C1 n=1 Tax=Oldenlandia corymbosa var. corymbosa TaxID=529605 RepID=A0AAV1ECG4_OLDCO|nr:OLC1v1018811C1 [Oldenlandia corymbosa var. corymbosa]
MVFDYKSILSELLDSDWHDETWMENRKRSDLNHIISTLQRYQEENIVVEMLKLDIEDSQFAGHINQCMELARGLIYMRHLSAVVASKGLFQRLGEKFFDLPVPVLEAESLVELHLRMFILKYHERVMWHNLERLRLDCVDFGPSMFKSVVTSCQRLRSLSLSYVKTNFVKLSHVFPHLEDLSIESCPCLETVQISSGTVRKIKLRDNYGLREAQFDVPNIVVFEYKGEVMTKLSFTAVSGRWTSRVKLHHLFNVNTSWFVRLKEFLTRLNKSVVHVDASFGDNVVCNLNEATKDRAFYEVNEEVAEFCVSISAYSALPEACALAIIDGIFYSCHPRVITTECNWHWHGITKLLHEMLVFRNQPDHSWPRRLKLGKDIELFNSKSSQSMQLDKTLEWKGFLKGLRAKNGLDLVSVSFNLEWRT